MALRDYLAGIELGESEIVMGSISDERVREMLERNGDLETLQSYEELQGSGNTVPFRMLKVERSTGEYTLSYYNILAGMPGYGDNEELLEGRFEGRIVDEDLKRDIEEGKYTDPRIPRRIEKWHRT